MADHSPIFELPATLEITFWATDGRSIVKIPCSLPIGAYPSQQTIERLMEEVRCEVATEMDGRYQLCGPHEFGKAVMMEQFKVTFAVPGPNQWAAPYTTTQK